MLLFADVYVNYQLPSGSSVIINYIIGRLTSTTVCKSITICHFLKFAIPCLIIQFKQINQQHATISQVYYLTFICGSICFGRLSAHDQERTTALGSSGITAGAWRLERC
jgi:hypothetical protein